MPKFSIGIPTFNRARWLKNAIDCALAQTYQDIEVLVSDNASTDNTPEVVKEYGSRVRYIRNETNIGPSANFRQLADLATGEYFSWLQDDDCIFNHFVERAVSQLDKYPEVTLYGAYAAVTGHIGILANSWLYGPPIMLDWNANRPRKLAGDLLVPLSLCESIAIPPVVAFRASALKNILPNWDNTIPLFMERTILCEVAATSEAIFDPYIAGIFRSHEQQNYRGITAADPDAQKKQWLAMAHKLDALPIRRNAKWDRRLRDLMREVGHRRQQWEKVSESWPQDVALCQQMRKALGSEPEVLSFKSVLKAGERFAKGLFVRRA